MSDGCTDGRNHGQTSEKQYAPQTFSKFGAELGKKKPPTAKRCARAKQQCFQEKKAAEEATLPKSTASEVSTTIPTEQETPFVSTSKNSCSDQESAGHSVPVNFTSYVIAVTQAT